MKAWAALAPIPIIGPALGAVAAGGIIAAGASYAAQSLQGRALGGQVRGGESYVVGERGPEVLTMGANGRITPNDKLRSESTTNNQNVSVSFNITATDASGFDQLLQARRGMIIGMINQAMNNRGRKALV
jgi:SLT domain-containing protein